MFPNAKIWTVAKINPARLAEVDRRVDIIVGNRKQYEQLEQLTGVPWYVTGCIHSLEADFNFHTILANGDPLGEPTKDVPRGLTANTWIEGGVISFQHEKWMHLTGWDLLANVLDRIEEYNGLGPRDKGVPSAYLYSFTNVYKCGKYTSDDHWSATAVSDQCGAVAILLRMVQRNILTQTGDTLMTTPVAPVPSNATSGLNLGTMQIVNAFITSIFGALTGAGGPVAILVQGTSWGHYIAAGATAVAGVAAMLSPILALVNSNLGAIDNTVGAIAGTIASAANQPISVSPTPPATQPAS